MPSCRLFLCFLFRTFGMGLYSTCYIYHAGFKWFVTFSLPLGRGHPTSNSCGGHFFNLPTSNFLRVVSAGFPFHQLLNLHRIPLLGPESALLLRALISLGFLGFSFSNPPLLSGRSLGGTRMFFFSRFSFRHACENPSVFLHAGISLKR